MAIGKYRPGVVGVFLLIHVGALAVFFVPFRALLWFVAS